MSTPDTSPQREGSELIERLRKSAAWRREHRIGAAEGYTTADDLDQAASRLQALERLRGELAQALENAAAWRTVKHDAEAKASTAEATCKELLQVRDLASTAEAEIARLSRERAQALESAAEWRRVGHDAKADALAAKASLARAVEVLEEARFALAEFYRYQHGGDGRNGGSYDGKPEREGLWRAERAVAAFLASLPKEKTHEG